MPFAFQDLRTVQQLSRRNPAFSQPSLRWLIFNAEHNGLNQAIVRIGRRVLIDEPSFNRWLDRQREGVDGMK